MKSKIKYAVVFITIWTTYAAAGVEISSRRHSVDCDREPEHMGATLSSSHSLAVSGPSPNDIASGTSLVTCWLRLIAGEPGSFLLEFRDSSLGAGKNLLARELTLSLQREHGTVVFRNIPSAGPLRLLPAEQGDQLNATWRTAVNSSLQLHASLLTNSSCGDYSMVNFRGACYAVRSAADVGGSSSPVLAEFGAQFQDEEQLRDFVQHAVMESPTLKDNLTKPVLLGMKHSNSQLMYQNRTTGPDQQCQWTEFRGSIGSNLTGATEFEVERPLVTLLMNRSSEPVLGLISCKEAASGQHQVLLKFIASPGLSSCDANSSAAAGCHAGDQASDKWAVILGGIVAAVIVAAGIVTAVVVLYKWRGRPPCPNCWNLPSPTAGSPGTHNGCGNGGTHASNGGSNGDAAASGCLLKHPQKEAESSV